MVLLEWVFYFALEVDVEVKNCMAKKEQTIDNHSLWLNQSNLFVRSNKLRDRLKTYKGTLPLQATFGD